MDHQRVTANDVEFAYLSDGPSDGPLALCLHGFPDTAHTWRHLLPELAAAGFHAVAPWMRGYAPSAVPADGAYQTGALATDACALHDALGGGDDAVLIGHDWGAFAAYGAAALQPGRWRRLVTLAVPPLAAMATSFLSYQQLKRSFYIFFFQSELAEAAVPLDDFAFVDHLWEDWSPGYDGGWDTAQVKAALADPQHLSAAIGYYRAMFDTSRHQDRYQAAQQAGLSPAPQPTLYLHGADDGCLGLDTVGDVSGLLAEGSRQVTVRGAGHFLHLQQPATVNGEIVAFVGS